MSQLVEKYLDDTGSAARVADQDGSPKAWRAARIPRDRRRQAGQRVPAGGRRQLQGRSAGATDLSSKGAVQGTDARRGGKEGIGAASWRRRRSICSIQSPSTTRSERSRCSSNGQSRATAASSIRSRTSASSAPRTSAKARSAILGPLTNSIACSPPRSTRAAGRSVTGSSLAIVVLRQSAKYWVPLIALFSGMRLGEIIQMQVADVKMSRWYRVLRRHALGRHRSERR